MFVIHFLSVSFSPTTMQTSCYESIDVEEKKCKRDGYYITQPFARRVNGSPFRFLFVDQDDEENRERKKILYVT